jgi:SAM-dependent methyltransferase
MFEPDTPKRTKIRCWSHQWRPLSQLRHRIRQVLTTHSLLRPGKRVVDLGCGSRPYEDLFRTEGCDYVGCDIDGNPSVLIRPGKPVAMPSAAADGVVSFQVLEHVWDLDWYLGECRRLLTPDGWLLLTTHGAWLYHPHPTDYRRWTRTGLLKELEVRGFTVESISGLIGPLAWTTQFRLLGLRHALQTIPVLGRCLVPLLACLLNLRMVVEDAITPNAIRQDNAAIYVVLARKARAET